MLIQKVVVSLSLVTLLIGCDPHEEYVNSDVAAFIIPGDAKENEAYTYGNENLETSIKYDLSTISYNSSELKQYIKAIEEDGWVEKDSAFGSLLIYEKDRERIWLEVGEGSFIVSLEK